MNKVYETQDAGFNAVMRELQNAGVQILESYELNQNRYVLTITKDKTYLILYKRDFFNSFGKIFSKEGESGVGETVNLDDLKTCVIKCHSLELELTDLVFVYESGKIYTISLNDFMEYSHKRETDAENKAVISVSIKHLKKFVDSLKTGVTK